MSRVRRKLHVKSVVGILILSVLHFIISLVVSLAFFGNALDRMYGDGEPLTATEHIFGLVGNVLHFPLIQFLDTLSQWPQEPLVTILFLLDSLLWGVCLYFLAVSFSKVVTRHKTAN